MRSIQLEIGKYKATNIPAKFQKMDFETIDEAIATINFIALGYDLFKNGEKLIVRLDDGHKPHLLDFASNSAIEEFRNELMQFYTDEKSEGLNLLDKTKVNSNLNFKEDQNTKYAKTSTGEILPFKLFSVDESEISENLLNNTIDTNTSSDFALVERRFAENKHLQFFGAEKIENHNDIAWLFKSLEDEAIEHAFLVYHFEDKGYFVQHISTGSFSQALVDNKALIGNVLKTNPTSITLVHNHPSGHLKASNADFKCLEHLRKALQYSDIEVNPGVIINLRSGKYLVFDDAASTVELRQASNKPTESIAPYGFSKQIFVQNFKPINVTNSKDVAEFISTQKFGISDKTEMLILNSQMHIVGKFLMPDRNQVEFIIDKVTQFGGMNCIMYGNNISPEEINFYNERLKHSTISILDALLFQSSNGIKMYKSFMDDDLLDRGKIEEATSTNTAEQHTNLFKNNNMENLSWFDKAMTPKTQEYKNFVQTLLNSPDEIHTLSDKERKFLKIYQNLDYAFSIIATDPKKNSNHLYHFEDKVQVIEFIDKIDSQNMKSYNLRDNKNQIDFPITNTAERQKTLSDLWAGEMENKTVLSSGLSANQIDEMQASYYRKYAAETEKLGLEISPFLPDALTPFKNDGDFIDDLFDDIENRKGDLWQQSDFDVIGGKIKDIAAETIKNPDYLKQFDSTTQKIITLFINNQNQNIMENNDFNQVKYLQDQMKYLGFGESEELHKDLENGINSPEKQFEIKTTSDRTLPNNQIEFTLNFNKSEKGGVFLNSYLAALTNDKKEALHHTFSVSKDNSFTAKEAINLLEGRSVKIEFENPKTDAKETAFVKLNFNEDKNEYGNYNFQTFYKNYGVDAAEIVEKSNLIFDKPEYKENAIASLEKGNIVKVKFQHEDKVIEGKAVLNPQYKNISLYDQDMTRINTNKPLEGLDNGQKQQKGNVREQSMSRGI